jgi:hypothetical protein
VFGPQRVAPIPLVVIQTLIQPGVPLPIVTWVGFDGMALDCIVPLQVWETSSPIPKNRKIVENKRSIDFFIGGN